MVLHQKLSTFFGLSLYIISTLFVARLVVDTGTRMVYPFIPQLSTGLGLSVIGFSWLIFFRAIAGMAGPIFGALADKFGRRKIMASGLLFQFIGAAGLIFSWQWWASIPMFFYGMSLAAFIPAEQAYISDRVAYEKRGRALATVEFSWALTGVVSLPIIGWMIDTFGWRFPFGLLSLMSLVGAAVIWFLIPAVEQRIETGLAKSTTWQVCRRPNVLASMGVGTLLFAGVGSFITIWGVWLSADFSLSASALGLVATAVGIAELSGSGLSSLFIDRIGKRRGSQLGLLGGAIAFFLLPFSQATLLTAVAALILTGIFVEFTIVSLLPLYAEQAPEARATVFSLVGFGISIGVAVGSPVAATLWENFGLWAVGLVTGGCLLLALALLTKYLFDDINLATS